MTPKISILIPHIPERRSDLNDLLSSIFTQVNDNHLHNAIEVIVLEDEFQVSIGCKRNLLLEMATGEFIMFVDDDDNVHKDFCKIVCDIISNKRIDYIGSKMERSFTNLPEYRSIRFHKKHYDQFGSYRSISHTTPIRRSIAALFKFPSLSIGEDEDWCEQIRDSGLVVKEYYCTDTLYYQKFKINKYKFCKSNEPIKNYPIIYKHIIDII